MSQNRRTITLAIAAIAVLAGCATQGDTVAQLSPAATYSSARSVASIEQCLGQSKLTRLGGPSVVRGERSTVVSFGSGGVTSYTITLTPSASGTSVSVRSGYPYFGSVRSDVERCTT